MNARVLLWAVVLTMAACSASPEVRYYTLSAAATDRIETPAGRAGRTYALDAVAIPDLLDRPQIVLRSSENVVEMLDYDRWAAPLPDQLRRVFAADLSARLGANAIIDPGLPSTQTAARRITISILEFEPGLGRESVVAASWAISGVGSKSATNSGEMKTFKARHIAFTARSGVRELVATMNELVTLIAEDIAVTLSSD